MKLFVYGTLKKGKPNHCVLGDSKFLGELKMWMPYKMLSNDWYPALVPSASILNWIQGEVYEISPEISKQVDILEGYPSLYKKATLITNFGHTTLYYMDSGYEGFYQVNDGHWD